MFPGIVQENGDIFQSVFSCIFINVFRIQVDVCKILFR